LTQVAGIHRAGIHKIEEKPRSTHRLQQQRFPKVEVIVQILQTTLVLLQAGQLLPENSMPIFHHVRRTHNKAADWIANKVMDEGQNYTRCEVGHLSNFIDSLATGDDHI